MEEIRIIDLKESILADNDADAEKLRSELDEQGTYYINVMSSPGSGKTSTILRLLEELRCRYKIGVLEADIDGDVDTRTMLDAGVASVQLHTGGMCHLDADMSRQGLKEIGSEELDLVILENVGNLVCPAEFDTGACLDIVILSTSEGDDKPLKYPLVFSKCDLVIISKIDAMKFFTFDYDKCVENIKMRNPDATVIAISNRTGEGIDALAQYFENKVNKFKEN